MVTLMVDSLVVAAAIVALSADNSGEISSKSEESNENQKDDSLEDKRDESYYLDLRGTLRKYFAIQTTQSDAKENVICSPVSALLPLGKLAMGAVGTSRRELLDAVGYRKSKLKRRFKKLISAMRYLPGVTLDVVSRLYVSKVVTLNKKFVRNAKDVFQSSVDTLDYNSPREAANRINSWVRKETNGMIDNIISPLGISSYTSLILINAIYFAGKWKLPFTKVELGSFHSPRGTKQVPMMTQSGLFKYTKSDILKAQIIEIPYTGDKASFVIVLPYTEKYGLEILLNELMDGPEILDAEMSRMRDVEIILTIPKFKVQTELDLKVSYEKLGLRSIFHASESKLSRILDDGVVYVSKAVQKAVIEVSEKGTEAAAASSVSITWTSLVKQIMFNADRPFLYYIVVDNQQLFAGIFNG
ncbi:antichymotrypsin-2 [Aphomia sociella]